MYACLGVLSQHPIDNHEKSHTQNISQEDKMTLKKWKRFEKRSGQGHSNVTFHQLFDKSQPARASSGIQLCISIRAPMSTINRTNRARRS